MQKSTQHSAQKAAFPNFIWKDRIKIWKGRIKCDSCHATYLPNKTVCFEDGHAVSKVKCNNPAINLSNTMVSIGNEDGHAV